MTAPRYCPLCDDRVEAVACPAHRVPTLAAGGAAGPVEPLEVGTVLVGRYRIDGLLQQGGMGVLLRGTRLEDGRDLVVKVLKGQRIRDINNVRRFYTEARVAADIRHPNVVQILEFGVDEATRAPFLAMERVPGRTLKTVLQLGGPLDERRAARIFEQVARALVAAHAQDVLHRDLKPSNIMVSEPGDQVKVLDFGLAKLVGPNAAPLTRPGKTVGTPAFMSPEQVAQLPQDFRTDLYGLGCVLHAALTGKPPFVGEDLIAVMRMQLRAETPTLPARLADGRAPSPDLGALFSALMAKHPADRPASTAEVAEAFARIAARPPSAQLAAPTEVAVPVYAEGDTTESSFAALAAAEVRESSEVSTGRAAAQDTAPDAPVAEDGGAAPTERGAPPPEPSGDATEQGELSLEDTALDAWLAERSADDLDTPLVAIEGLEAPNPATEDLVTTILPRGLDAMPEETAEGPIFGRSLLAAAPRPTAANPPRRGPAAPPRDPAEERPIPRPAPHGRRGSALLFGALLVAALLVGLAASSVVEDSPPPAREAPTPVARPAARPAAETPASRRGIRVISRPDGARVFVDGQDRGATPLWLPRPPAGARVRVRLERPGFPPQALELHADSPTQVEVGLEPHL